MGAWSSLASSHRFGEVAQSQAVEAALGVFAIGWFGDRVAEKASPG